MTTRLPNEPARRIQNASEVYVPGPYVQAYIEAARSVDVEPYRQLRQARLPTTGLDNDDVTVPQERFLELLAATARVAQRADFTFCVLSRLSLTSFGPAGLLASAQPTLRDAINVLCQFSSNPKRKMRATLEERGGEAAVRLNFKQPSARQAATSALMGLGIALRAIQSLVGDDWRPTRVAFSAPAPADIEPYRQMFGDVAFDQPIDALSFDRMLLSRRLPSANPGLARLVGHYLDELSSTPTPTFEEHVRELIVALLPRGICTIERVAQHLGVDRRTVHRRLFDQGLSFTALVHEARLDMIEAELKDRRRPIATLATALGFSCNSTFSRWFRQTYGVSASQFRRAA